MQDEFYATIKLVSGEEVFSKVSPCEEDDRIILIFDNPVIMEHIQIPSIDCTMISVNPWIKNSNEEIYLVDMNKVITITEVKDKDILKVYKKYLKTKNKITKKIKVTPNMGFVSSIETARETLEKIYKSK